MKLSLIVIVACFCSFNIYGQQSSALFELEVGMKPAQKLPLGKAISFKVDVSNAEALATNLLSWNNISSQVINEATLLITVEDLPEYNGSVSRKDLESTFVIDFAEKATKPFIKGFKYSNNQAINLKKLTAYVNRYIENVTYINGFNFASTVATQRSGDCTEFSVLTVALSRSLDLPARLVLGTVLTEDSGKISAYGHAWAEVWQHGKWHTIDAALYGSTAKLTYLPTSILQNEGPGYSMAIVNSTYLMPHKIYNLESH